MMLPDAPGPFIFLTGGHGDLVTNSTDDVIHSFTFHVRMKKPQVPANALAGPCVPKHHPPADSSSRVVEPTE